MAGLLDGIRVLDLADASGAMAGKLLAGLGADVVLLEPPGGHAMRRIPPFAAGAAADDASLFFWFYAAGKRSRVLDRTTSDGQAQLDALLACADVVIDTDAPGTALPWLARCPRLVAASITPFGQTGPYAAWRSSDLVAQAMGGMLYINGHADGPPIHTLGLQAYHQAGVFAATGIVGALLARERTGRGQHVDVSLQAAVTGSLEHAPGFFLQDGRVVRRQGTLHWTRFFRVARCRDGYVMHCTLGDWTTLLEWARSDGYAESLTDPRFEESPYRQVHGVEIFDELDRWALNYTVDELYEGAQLRRIPYAAVRPPEALLGDPHLAARGFFVPLDHPALPRTVPFPAGPFQCADGPWRTAPPPQLDADAAAIRAGWGS